MAVVLLACQIFKREHELLSKEIAHLPETRFLETGLHNQPDVLRAAVQKEVDAFEARHSEEPLTILMGYGLCGRALCGVHARRATLVFPRVHDCISLLLGLEHSKENAFSREGAVYWISPGFLEYFQIDLHLHYDKRFALYEEKFGTAKATRMMKAEKALYKNYAHAGHIVWPEMGDLYVDTAQKVATEVGIPYVEYPGRSAFLRELLEGGHDEKRFLRLEPGQTIDMDPDGGLITVRLSSETNDTANP